MKSHSDLLDYDCVMCAGFVPVENIDADQVAACEDCGTHYKVWYDAEFVNGSWRGTHHLTVRDG